MGRHRGRVGIAGGDYEVCIGAHALDEDGPTQTIKLAPSLLHWHPPSEAPVADAPPRGIASGIGRDRLHHD
ncbi:hypothetical protein GCM10010317_000280 [Streptomyces mirabilis]|nr:hypothetical protein GCM10010317_000280 [Streptomyces mirabilis]